MNFQSIRKYNCYKISNLKEKKLLDNLRKIGNTHTYYFVDTFYFDESTELFRKIRSKL